MSKEAILQARLEEINRCLAKYGVSIRKVGDYTRGEYEISYVVSVYDYHTEYLTVVTFEARKPLTGEAALYTMIFNSQSDERGPGAVTLLVNGRKELLLVKQHRPTLGRWTWEVPRGFAPPDLKESKVGDFDLSLAISHREVPGMRVNAIEKLAAPAENTGISAVELPVYLLRVDSFEPHNTKERKFRWVSIERAEEMIFDLHSVGALFYLKKKLERD